MRNNSPQKIYLNCQNSLNQDFDLNPKEQYGWGSLWVNEHEAGDLLNAINSKQTISHGILLQYSTPLLDITKKAIEVFWMNYDENNPPKSADIVPWLQKQGAAKRIALVIDSIIRPPSYKKGGNRTRKKTIG